MDVQNGHIAHVKLITEQDEIGGYKVYVFENLDYTDWYDKYIMCVRYPNWDAPDIKIDEEGYLSFTEIIPGNQYFNVKTRQTDVFLYSHIRFNKFVRLKEKVKLDNVVL